MIPLTVLIKQAYMTNKLHSQGTCSEKMSVLLTVDLGNLKNFIFFRFPNFKFVHALFLQNPSFIAYGDESANAQRRMEKNQRIKHVTFYPHRATFAAGRWLAFFF